MMSTIAATTATATTSSNSPTCETHDVSFTGYFPDPLRIFYLVWVDRAFNGFLIPLLGLIVFPYATLFYVLAYNPVSGGLSGWGWIFVVLGFVFDIGHWVGGGVTGRQRYALNSREVSPTPDRISCSDQPVNELSPLRTASTTRRIDCMTTGALSIMML